MDRKWVRVDRLSEEYRNGVEEFCNYAIRNCTDHRYIPCPCWKCMNGKTVRDRESLFTHLMIHGIDKVYTVWTFHGETRYRCSSSNLETDFRFEDTVDADNLEDVPTVDTSNVDGDELRDHPYMSEKLDDSAGLPLWPGCEKTTKLSAVLILLNFKAAHALSDTCFTSMLEAISDLLPDGNVLPKRAYDAKQMLKSIGLTHKKIHVCPDDCILFRKEYADLDECLQCGKKRYKKNKSPAKVMWYFPIIPRFRRMYSSAVDARNLTWHHDDRIKDGMLRHPADSPQWKTFDVRHPEFGNEPRHLRLERPVVECIHHIRLPQIFG